LTGNQCYAYANYALIGGGFGKGIHNILEAAVFGLPVFFGANYTKAQEAIDLVDKQLAFKVRNASQVQEVILSMDANTKHQNKTALLDYFKHKIGATELIFNHINHNSLFL